MNGDARPALPLLAFLLSLALSEMLRRICLHWRVLDHPTGARWHRSPRPRLGGVAMFAAISMVLLIASRSGGSYAALPTLLAGAAFVFTWGVIDDLRPLPPILKLILLALTGAIPPLFGVVFPTPWPAVSMLLTAGWVTGVTNAVNWFDNMDGAAAGVVVLAGGTLAALSITSGNNAGAAVGLGLAGAALGFLMLNFPPARIFMGDCGSGVLGYLLAVGAVLLAPVEATSPRRLLLTATFIAGVPLLDTGLVVVHRMLHRRSIFAGGRDHLAHRLVALGLSERETLATLYALALATGAVAMLTFVGPGASAAVGVGAGTALAAAAAIAASVAKVYQRPSPLRIWMRAAASRWGYPALYAGVLASGLGLLYAPVVGNLILQWRVDREYSHGPLIPIVSAYLVWRERDRLRHCRPSPSAAGYVVIMIGVALLIAGDAAVVGYLMRVSLLVVLAGIVLFLFGWQALRLVALPLVYLLFMIPLPYLIFDRLTLPLQFLATGAATSALDIVGIPVHQDGNIITLTVGQLGVTEACSGIRSVLALGATGTFFAVQAFPDWWRRAAVFVSTIPIAILTNAARIAVTGVLANGTGLEQAMGFYHTFSGLVIFGLAAVLLALEGMLLARAGTPQPGKSLGAQGA